MKMKTDSQDTQIRRVLEELQGEFTQTSDQEIVIHAFQDSHSGYRIEKSGDECTIRYAEKTDFCRALLHVSQMPGDGLAESSCRLDKLGYMCDCSRNAVPAISTLRQLVRMLALMGYHYLGLYTEDTFKVPQEPYFGYMRGAYTSQEIRELVSYADIFGMEIRPYIQTLAHFNALMRYEMYNSHMDVNDILLPGDERTYEFLDHLIHIVSDTYKTRNINIGMDEAHMVGLGKYLDIHGYENRFQIMEQHLKRVLEICRKYGLHVQMWSDMFFRLAYHGDYYIENKEDMEKLNIPDDVELCYWDYYATDRSHYIKMLESHRKLTQKIAFAAGAWKWTGFTPNNAYSIESAGPAIEACVSEKISDVVITGWGDDGAEASIFSTMPALAFDADKAYGTKDAENGLKQMTGMSFEELMKMDSANPFPQIHDRHNNAGKYFLYNDPLIGTFDSVVQQDTNAYYHQATDELETLVQKYKSGRYVYLFKTQKELCSVLSDKADLGCRIREAYQNVSGGNGEQKVQEGREELQRIAAEEIPEIIRKTDALYESLRYQWNSENKSFGFEVQSIRFGGLKQRLEEVGRIIGEYLQGERSEIEELAEEYLPFRYFNEDDPMGLSYNLWTDIVTPGRLY